MAQACEKLKSKIRARVEHPFHVIKNLFHYKKTRYQGIAKNDTQLNMLFGLSNLYMMRGSCARNGQRGARCAAKYLEKGKYMVKIDH